MVTKKTKQEIETLRQGGKILASIIKKLEKEILSGANTGDLEKMTCDLIIGAGGRPSFKGYKTSAGDRPFPTALCASINDEVVHAPSLPARGLREGDIIGLDIGMEYPFTESGRGMYTDMAMTVGVGKISEEAKKLITIAKESLYLAIKQVKPGRTLNDIGRAIQKHIEDNGFFVVRDLVGHGVGYAVHEDPKIPNYFSRGNNIVLETGMVLAIEPMVNIGSAEIEIGNDGFTFKTGNKKLSAHFEHTIVVTEDGCEVLTEISEN